MPSTLNEDVEVALRGGHVGREIRRIRRRAGMTQTDFAVAVFGSAEMQAHLSRWERGLIEPQVASLELIARWAKVPLSIFDPVTNDGGPNRADIEEAKALVRDATKALHQAMTLLGM